VSNKIKIPSEIANPFLNTRPIAMRRIHDKVYASRNLWRVIGKAQHDISPPAAQAHMQCNECV